MKYPEVVVALSKVRCPDCGRRFTADHIRGLGEHNGRTFVRVACLCGMISAYSFSIKPRKKPPITIDEVLDLHDFLESHAGDLASLLGSAK